MASCKDVSQSERCITIVCESFYFLSIFLCWFCFVIAFCLFLLLLLFWFFEGRGLFGGGLFFSFGATFHFLIKSFYTVCLAVRAKTNYFEAIIFTVYKINQFLTPSLDHYQTIFPRKHIILKSFCLLGQEYVKIG